MRDLPRNGSRQSHWVYPQPQRWSHGGHRASAFHLHSLPELAAIDRSHVQPLQQQQQQQPTATTTTNNTQEDEWKNIHVVILTFLWINFLCSKKIINPSTDSVQCQTKLSESLFLTRSHLVRLFVGLRNVKLVDYLIAQTELLFCYSYCCYFGTTNLLELYFS